MRQATTAEVRLDEGKPPVPAPRGPASRHFGYQRVACDRISLPRNPQGRKITSKRAENPENVG